MRRVITRAGLDLDWFGRELTTCVARVRRFPGLDQ
jgi:hypothetical protein